MIYGFTGHRPPKLGGYGRDTQQKLYTFAHKIVRLHLHAELHVRGYPINPLNTAIIGMAQGWDMAVAQACLALHIPYTAAIPYPGQENVWPDKSIRDLYKSLIEDAAHRIYVSPTPGPHPAVALQLRNQWIVDHSDRLIALWDEEEAGGTWNCVKYARRQDKMVINVWQDWEVFQ